MSSPPGNPFWPGTELKLINRLADAADHSAWTTFVERYRPPIRRTALRAGLSETDAEEVVQRTFIAVHRSLGTYAPHLSRFRTWLGGIVRNRIHEVVRETKGQPQQLRVRSENPAGAERPQSVPTVEPYLPFEEEDERELDAQAWERLKSELRPVHWQVLYDLVVRGHSAGEVAKKYGLQRGNVYVIKLRGLPKLRAIRQQLEVEDELGIPKAQDARQQPPVFGSGRSNGP
jgi:RNA polymerase sigma factor (sigma-70 family)